MNNTDPNEQNNVEFYTDDDLILRLLREFEKEKADFFEEAIKTNRPYIANPLELMNGFHGDINELIELFIREKDLPGLSATETILKAPLFLRAAIKYKIDHNSFKFGLELVQASMELVQHLYETYFLDHSHRRHYIDKFLNEVKSMRISPDFENLHIDQEADSATIAATNIYDIRSSSFRLKQRFGGKKVIILPLANGAIPTGLLTFLLGIHSGAIDLSSIIYPVRFSTIKLNDSAPHLTSSELNMIGKYIKMGYSVCPYEEDMVRGYTMKKMVDYLHNSFGKNIEIVPNWAVNNSKLFLDIYD